MFLQRSIIAVAGLVFILPHIVMAQNTSSPYSVLGIGDIESSSLNRYTGMANAGVALTDPRNINNSNAASLTGLHEHFYTFEISTRYRQAIFKGLNISAPDNKSADFAVSRINLAMKVAKRWGSSVGLQPFSTANYSYTAFKNIGGTLQNVAATYEGEGGVNQFYWANGYQLTKNTSIGVTASFLFGSLRQTENLLSGDNSTVSLATIQNTYLRNYYFNFAMQTGFRLNSKWQTRYGITYSPKTDLYAENTTNVTSADGVAIKSDAIKNDFFTLPGNLNLGVAFIKNSLNTFTVNAQSQNWSSLNYQGTNYQLVNSNKLSFGFQQSKREKDYYNREYEKGYFQLGFYAGQSYLKVKNVQITDIGGSIGYGINSRTSPISMLIALEGGRRGASTPNILSENYINLNFTFSYIDLLYRGKKYN
ncbi:MAG: outer membrane protein [Ferruginibacter sp.]|nr:outer membrane protein [Ferruginibacter sp.]